MRKFAASGAAILFAVASMGTAIPARAQADAPVPFAWTGGYVGAFVGGVYHLAWWEELDDDWWETGNKDAPSLGVYGGGYAGFNWLYVPGLYSYLYGFEADIGIASNSTTDNLGDKFDDVEHNELHWLATFRARAGIAQDALLLFVTGGLAIADFTTFMTSVRFPDEVYTANGVRVGWVAGGGLEYPLGDLEYPLWDKVSLRIEGLSLRIEGLYHDFGSNVYKQPKDGQRNEISNNVVTVRVGLTAYLNWPSL